MGFVSNSSVSSFIVRTKTDGVFKISEDWIANEEDIKKLKKYGFKKSYLKSPFKLSSDGEVGEVGPSNISMKYRVNCNQDAVIYFLVKNNIPFKSSCHYDHEYVSYQKDSDYIFIAANYGLVCNMYGDDYYDYFEMIDDLEPIKKKPKDEWIEEYLSIYGGENDE